MRVKALGFTGCQTSCLPAGSNRFAGTHFALDATRRGMDIDAEIVGGLKVDPEFGRVSKVARETQRGISVKCAPAADDLAQSAYGDFQITGQTGDRKSKRLHEVFPENLTRMNRRHLVVLLLGHDGILGVCRPLRGLGHNTTTRSQGGAQGRLPWAILLKRLWRSCLLEFLFYFRFYLLNQQTRR